MPIVSYKGKRKRGAHQGRKYALCALLVFLLGLCTAGHWRPPQPAADSPETLEIKAPVAGLEEMMDTVIQAADVWQEDLAQRLTEVKHTMPFFVGNSLIEGMRLNSDDAYSFFCKVGISLKELNQKITQPKEFDCAIIEMGSNELGVYSREEFIKEYVKLVQELGCPCYCLSIPPVNEGKSKYAPRVNNENVRKYNGYIKEICQQTGAEYIDCTSFFGETLNGEWTHDGLHLNPDIYAKWYRWALSETRIEGA